MESKLDIMRKVLLLKNGLRYFLNNIEYGLVYKAMKGEFMEVQGDIISTSQIEGIFTPDKVEEADKRRRGMWMCRYNKWHSRQDNCECGRQH